MLRMEKDCKVYSLALMDRMIHMNNLVQIYASYLANGQNTKEASAALYDQITPVFIGLGLYSTESGLVILSGSIDLQPDVDLFDHLLQQQGKSSVYTGKIRYSQQSCVSSCSLYRCRRSGPSGGPIRIIDPLGCRGKFHASIHDRTDCL